MKLSEAILQGCEISEENKQNFFSYDHRNTSRWDTSSSCALGSALLVTYEKEDLVKEEVVGLLDKCKSKFKILNKRIEDFPKELKPKLIAEPCLVSSAIMSLNDKHGWSREAIAMWVTTLEDYLEQESEKNLQKAETNPTELVGEKQSA